MVDKGAEHGRPDEAPGLEHYPVEDGCLIYQPSRDRVHFLNETAYAVLLLCGGQPGVDRIAGELARTYRLQAPPLEMVREVLDRLAGEGLIVFS